MTSPKPLAGASQIPVAEVPVRATPRVGDLIGFLYRCYDRDGVLVYIGSTSEIYQRMNVHSRQTEFYDRFASVRYWIYPNVTEARAAEHEAIADERPALNRRWNPDYTDLPKAERDARFAAALAAVPVAGERPSIEDGRPAEVVAAEMREAMNRINTFWMGLSKSPPAA